jgi:hypothetical protein
MQTTNDRPGLSDGTTDEDMRVDEVISRYVAIKFQLSSLAYHLADEALALDLDLEVQECHFTFMLHLYACFRLDRVMVLLPELQTQIDEKLRLGRLENKIKAQSLSSE